MAPDRMTSAEKPVTSAAPGLVDPPTLAPESIATDRAFLEWLQDQAVDVIYLDDGRLIDVRGGDVRRAIAEAMERPAPAETEAEVGR